MNDFEKHLITSTKYKENSDAVSYTHLDVYKRQPFNSVIYYFYNFVFFQRVAH